MHLHICDIVARRVEMLGHRKSKSVLAYASQMLTKSTSEALPSFTDVEMGASVAGYAVHKIFRYTCKKVHLGPGISVRGLMYSQVLQRKSRHAHDSDCSVKELSLERTSMFCRLRSRLYATSSHSFADLLVKCESSELDTV